MIVVVDYGLGNVGSVLNMLRRIGHTDAAISAAPDVIAAADRIILPGVGAFDEGMQRIDDAPGLRSALDEVALRRRRPVLGVCLGMQMLGTGSEEGAREGLGWIDARCVGFRGVAECQGLRVPHMGWNAVRPRRSHALGDQLPPDARFYFVHSYFMRCGCPDDVLFETEYGLSFASGVQRENIIGVQFHPEKSHRYGFLLLSAFAAL
jgi:glutamine amidotransferase